MKIFEIIDLLQRRINSFIFRFLLLIYAAILLFTHDNILPAYIYLIIGIVYFVLYISFLKKQRLRLFNDFIFISLIILGKNPNEAFILIFLILPIINSINFSGNKKSFILYFVTIITYLLLLCYYSHKVEIIILKNSILPVSSFFFLWIIEGYTSLRIKIRNFRDLLNEVVDGFYTNDEFIKKPYKIYNEIIKAINTQIKGDLIKELYCFTTHPQDHDKLVIINGSTFIWRYEIKSKNFLEKFDKRDYQLNVDLTIDNKPQRYNLIHKIEIEGVKYIYIFTTTKSIPFYYILIGFFRTLFPSLSKMSKILLMEKKLQDLRNEELQKFSLRSQYITRATKTMHFIRNRLGPVNNLLKMLDNRSNINGDLIKEFDILIEEEKQRAKNEVDSILSRANYLLEKTNNPFNFVETKPISIEKFYSILRRILSIYFPDISINVFLPDVVEQSYVNINYEGFELFLSDWLNNIKKYFKEYIEVKYIVNSSGVTIEFINDYKIDEQDIDKLIVDLMSNDRNEIMKRTTHGLYHIKLYLEEMAIDYHVSKTGVDKNLLLFRINLKISKI